MRFIEKVITLSFIAVLGLAIGGCANNSVNPAPEPAKQQVSNEVAAREKAVMDSFKALVQEKDVTASAVMKFVDDNIAAVSPNNASTMVIDLEKIQNEKLPKLQDEFSASEASQETLAKGSVSRLTDSYINKLENKDVKGLLTATKNGGFKIETAEGMYFPVIDYSVYKKYRSAVTQDIAAFIDIMAAESDKTPVKDAALMINWEEILKRAMAQEQFIKEYGNSAKAEDMRQLLKRYTAFALYGANNTPLFSYDTQQMASSAKKTYLETAFDADNGGFSKVMSGYLAVLKQNDYNLTGEVQKYRNSAMEEFH